MAKINHTFVKDCYRLAKDVYEKKIAISDAATELEKLGMNKSSAFDYLYFYNHAMDGEVFTRTINKEGIIYYLEHIMVDSGGEALSKVLRSLIAHVDYYEDISKSNQKSVREIIERYQSILDNQDEKEQQVVAKAIKNENNKNLRATLANLDFDKKTVEVSGKCVTRNNYAIALIKKIRGYKCQLCGTTIKKRNGEYYIEAAHIKPSSEGGKEVSENIILLCPNHHKQLDVGNSKVKMIDGYFEITIDEEMYKVKISE